MSNEFIKIVTNETFDDIIKESELVLVDFWATWCGPCRMIAPAVDAIAELNYGKVLVSKADVDDCGATAEKLNIYAVPTLKLYKDGVEVESVSGVRTQAQLQAMLDKYIQK